MCSRLIVFAIAAAGLMPLTGCGQNGAGAPSSDSAMQSGGEEKGGAELWAQNCSRCHNLRPPQSYSDAQWQAIVMHMRLRADLTGPESRAITAFLQASH